MFHPSSMVSAALGCSPVLEVAEHCAQTNFCISRQGLLELHQKMSAQHAWRCFSGLPLLQYVRDEREDFLHAFVEMGQHERNIVAANNAYLAEEDAHFNLAFR